MATTNHLGITLVDQSQSQKEVTVNQAFTRVDAMLNTGAKSRVTNTPPGSPASGDLYIVGSSPTGAWATHALSLAYFDQTWKFIAPGTGMTLYVNDESKIYSYSGSAWVAAPSGTVTSASVVSANGFAGSIGTPTSTPAITISTSITGMLKGNGTALSAATAGTDYVAPGTVTGYTAQQYAAASALTAGTTVSWNLNSAQAATLTPAQNFTLSNPSNMQAGGAYTLIITQDGTGSRVITWGSAYKFSGGSKFVLSTAAAAVDILSFYSDGTYMYGVGQAAFS